MEKFKWLKEHFSSRKTESWNLISNIIPDIFDDYFIVHWKVGIIDSFPFDHYPEQNETIEQTDERIKIEQEFGLFLNPNREKLFREISLREVSERFKTEYNYKILDNIKITPAIQILEEETKKALKSSLEKISTNQILNLFIKDIYRFSTEENPIQEYSGIDIQKYLEIQDGFYFDYCTYLFPDNLSWCLITAEDSPMLFCIKKELSEKICTDFKLELFKVKHNEELC